MDVAELLDVGEHLVGAGAGDRAGGRKGVADQDDAGLAIARRDVEIGRPDLDVAGNANSPVMRRSRGSAAFSVSAGLRRISRSQGSSVSR